ncbi:MAG: PilN domain-containing protein, partial [Dehalococcoidales bacterium]
SLSGELGRPVLPLPSPIDCPGGLDTSRYMVNMGLTIKEALSEKETRLIVTNINVLPVPYRPKPISLTNILALPATSAAVGFLVLFAMLIQSTSTDVAAMRGQLNTTDQLLQQKLSQREELTENVAGLENKIAEAEASSDNFIRAFGSLEKQSNGIYGLELAVNRLPRTISLTSINYANRILTISGRTPSEDEVLSYLQDLDKGGGFPQITITSMKRIETEGMDFTLVLKIGE